MRGSKTQLRTKLARIVAFALVLPAFMVAALCITPPAVVHAADSSTPVKLPEVATDFMCGSGKNAVHMSINIGCRGASCTSTSSADGCSALLDMTFAIVRFLSAGVGIVIVGSTIFAGIQYTTSRGDPKGTAQAISRLTNNGLALLMFIFGYALLNFIIPAGFFK